MKIESIVYIVDPFSMEVRRAKIVGEEIIGGFLGNDSQILWKVKDSLDGAISHSHKKTTFATVEEATKCIEQLLNGKLKVLKKKTNTKEKLICYLYELASLNEKDNCILEYLEEEIYKHTNIDVSN